MIIYALFLCLNHPLPGYACSMVSESFRTIAECNQRAELLMSNTGHKPPAGRHFVCMKHSLPTWESAE